MKRSDYQSLTEAAQLVVETAHIPHMKAAKAFLSAADDHATEEPIKRKHVIAAASAIAKHHSDWDVKKASNAGTDHFVHSSTNQNAKSPGHAMEIASKALKINPDLHNALMGHMHDTYGKDQL